VRLVNIWTNRGNRKAGEVNPDRKGLKKSKALVVLAGDGGC